jgi:hypothetical protein
MKSATNRLRGGSPPMTIALQPTRRASPTMLFVALRVAMMCPSALTPARRSASIASATSS